MARYVRYESLSCGIKIESNWYERHWISQAVNPFDNKKEILGKDYIAYIWFSLFQDYSVLWMKFSSVCVLIQLVGKV